MSEASEHLEQGVVAHLGLLLAVARKLTGDCATARRLTEHAISRVLRMPEAARATQPLKSLLLSTLRRTYIECYRDKPVIQPCPGREVTASLIEAGIKAEKAQTFALSA